MILPGFFVVFPVDFYRFYSIGGVFSLLVLGYYFLTCIGYVLLFRIIASPLTINFFLFFTSPSELFVWYLLSYTTLFGDCFLCSSYVSSFSSSSVMSSIVACYLNCSLASFLLRFFYLFCSFLGFFTSVVGDLLYCC